MGNQTRNYYVHVFTFILARQDIKLRIIDYSTSPYLLFNKIFQKRYIEKKKEKVLTVLLYGQKTQTILYHIVFYRTDLFRFGFVSGPISYQ